MEIEEKVPKTFENKHIVSSQKVEGAKEEILKSFSHGFFFVLGVLFVSFLSITLFLKTTEEKKIKREESKSECCFSKENDLAGILSVKDERFIFRAYLWLRKTFFPTYDNLKAVEELEMWRKTQTIN